MTSGIRARVRASRCVWIGSFTAILVTHHRRLSDGVSELKVDVGPGCRVYYTQGGNELIILLAGGDKSSLQRDIKLAIDLARNVQG